MSPAFPLLAIELAPLPVKYAKIVSRCTRRSNCPGRRERMARDPKHPARETLRRFLHARLPGPAMKAVVEHLLHGCGHCRKRLTALAGGLFHPGLTEAPSGGQQYSRAITAALRRAQAAVEVRRGGAPKPALEERLAVYHRCLEESRKLRETNLKEMMWAAQWAVFTAAGFQPEDFLPGVAYDLRARAWAELGNACRITEEFAEAEEAFENAMLYLWGGSGQNEALRAQLLDLYASLDRAQRRFEQAFSRLDEVYEIYVKLGDFHMAGRALVNKGLATMYANEPEAAIPLIRSGLNWLEPGRDPGLYLIAVHNLADAYVRVDQFEPGRALIAEHQALYIQHAGPLFLLRLRWNEGKIAAGLEEPAIAETIFEQVRQAFADRELAFDSALVSLDLAALLLEQGRTHEVAVLATEMVATFRRLGIRREAIAALLLFERAATQERATLALLRHVAARLRDIEQAPRMELWERQMDR
jgi:tetratricopeptide (TPR) repeat protein